jgi:hypothetical protein
LHVEAPRSIVLLEGEGALLMLMLHRFASVVVKMPCCCDVAPLQGLKLTAATKQNPSLLELHD